jgi:biopolymer transport protein ExbD
MKPQRLRTKLRKIREMGEEAAEEGGELNIIPYLDIVVNIIMFMLVTTTFAAALGDINVVVPPSSNAVSASPPDQTPKAELNLTLVISGQGFTLATSGQTFHQGYSFSPSGDLVETTNIIPTIPKKPNGDYDYETLAAKLMQIKGLGAAKDETKILVNPNAEIAYDIIVQALDAARGELIMKDDPDHPGKKMESFSGFPDVVFSAGAN